MTIKRKCEFIVLLILFTSSILTTINYFIKGNVLPIGNYSFNKNDSIMQQNDSESSILTANLSYTHKYKQLFQLDANVRNRTMEMTQNYFLICGKTLLNEMQFCAENILQIKANPGEMVPNIIHYVLLNISDDIQFYHLVCMMSAFWINQPKLMILWYDVLPRGNHWNYLSRNLSSVSKQIILMPILFPTRVYSHKLNFVQHYSDVVRLELLISFGGIYLDMDVAVVKSFQPLFNYSFTIGREIATGLCTGIMVSKRGNNLLKRWHMLYRFYPQVPGWGTMSVSLINTLQIIFPEYVHVEKESTCRPNWLNNELTWLFGKKRVWNWKEKNYSVHMWIRRGRKNPTWKNILTEDSMFGDIFRWILFGKTDLIVTNNTKAQKR